MKIQNTGMVAALAGALCLGTALTALPTAAHAENDGPWQIRVRGLAIIPDEDGTTTIGGDVDVDDAYVPEVDITYFMDENWALELIAATAPHDTAVNGTGIGNVDLGDVWLLPPTLLLQYHFDPAGQIRPYVGAGVNYTIFYNEDVPNTGPVTSIDYDDSFGWALQAGVDFDLGDGWLANIDVKKLFLETDVSVNGGAITGTAEIDPWIIGVGVGYRY